MVEKIKRIKIKPKNKDLHAFLIAWERKQVKKRTTDQWQVFDCHKPTRATSCERGHGDTYGEMTIGHFQLSYDFERVAYMARAEKNVGASNNCANNYSEKKKT